MPTFCARCGHSQPCQSASACTLLRRAYAFLDSLLRRLRIRSAIVQCVRNNTGRDTKDEPNATCCKGLICWRELRAVLVVGG